MALGTTFNGAVIVSQSEGWNGLIRPLGMEFEVREGSPIFKYLMKKFPFGDYIKTVLKRKPHPEDPIGKLEQLKEDVKFGTIKIRIEFYVETKIE
jgi:hypothetical protein